jgi:hypothetical protein
MKENTPLKVYHHDSGVGSETSSHQEELCNDDVTGVLDNSLV